MTSLVFASRFLTLLVAVAMFSLGPGLEARDTFRPLFNGKDLSGWKGDTTFWKVEKGVLVGSTHGLSIEANTFLIWEGEQVFDFHLKAKLKVIGNNNSGIMYRAGKVEGTNFGLRGNQLDIHPKPEYLGMLYSEKTGRGIIAKRGQEVFVPSELDSRGKARPQVQGTFSGEPIFDPAAWNEYEIIAVGSRLIHKVNGVVTVDVTDHHPHSSEGGVIGIQLHTGESMKVLAKDIQLKAIRNQDMKNAF